MQLRILNQNLGQCLTFLGDDEQGVSHYKGFEPTLPIDLFVSLSPDLCFFSEILINDENEITRKLSKELGLEFHRTQIVEECWLPNLSGLRYGLSFLSKYPIKSYNVVKFTNPKLVNIQKDGSLFKTHDKYAQLIEIELPNSIINCVNLHSFPFHRFNENISSPHLKEWRKDFEESLNIRDTKFIMAGDFNNKHFRIDELLTSSFMKGHVFSAINFQDTSFEISFDRPKEIDSIKIYGPEKKYASPSNQIDYVLLSSDIKVMEKRLIITESDHPLLFSVIKVNS